MSPRTGRPSATMSGRASCRPRRTTPARRSLLVPAVTPGRSAGVYRPELPRRIPSTRAITRGPRTDCTDPRRTATATPTATTASPGASDRARIPGWAVRPDGAGGMVDRFRGGQAKGRLLPAIVSREEAQDALPSPPAVRRRLVGLASRPVCRHGGGPPRRLCVLDSDEHCTAGGRPGWEMPLDQAVGQGVGRTEAVSRDADGLLLQERQQLDPPGLGDGLSVDREVGPPSGHGGEG